MRESDQYSRNLCSLKPPSNRRRHLKKVAVLPCNVCKAFISGKISTSISSPSHGGFFTPAAGTYAVRSYGSRDTLHASLTALRVIEIGPLWLHSCHKQAGTSQSSPSRKKKKTLLNKPAFLFKYHTNTLTKGKKNNLIPDKF